MQQGIDVAAKREDIRLIVLKHFSVPGVHPDDLVQEVLLGILQRNGLPGSAWDPARGSFGTYVYMVAKNVAARLARREARQYRARAALAEQLGHQRGANVAGLNGWPTHPVFAREPVCVPQRPRRPRRAGT